MMGSLTNALRPAQRPIDRLLKPFLGLSKHTLAGAGLLMLATAAAIVWANSPWAHSYHHLLELQVGASFGAVSLHKTLHHWINDGLMSFFFFLVGLEIKRELLVGELSSVRKATLPAIAAVGGMVVPALVYVAINPTAPTRDGWGVPMATDIAFALGVLALLGKRVPIGLKVFLTALAIVDDIGAVLVIAIFYTTDVSFVGLIFGFACLVTSAVLNATGARNPVVYLIVGVCAWLGFLQSGVHATIAAILMAFTIPARTRIDGDDFVNRIEILVARLKSLGVPKDTTMNDNAQQHCLERIAETVDYASAPLQSIEHALHAPVTFVVLPVFALANAGVTVEGDIGAALGHPVVIGIVGGLVLGKAVGITLSSWIAVKVGLADLPKGVSWTQVIGVGLLGGIGFTMAFFVSSLAFVDVALLETAKLGILVASAIAGILGFALIRFTSPERS